MGVLGQIDLDGLTHIGDEGIAIALLISAIVFVVTISWVIHNWLKTRRGIARLEHERAMKQITAESDAAKDRLEAENRREAERLAVERQQTNVLEDLQRELKRGNQQREADRTIWESLAAAVQQMTTVSTSLNTRLVEADERMQKISERRDHQYDQLQTRVQSVAGTVKAELQPQIDALCARIEQHMGQLETYISEQLDQLGTTVSEQTRQMLKLEIQTYLQQSTRKLEQVSNVARELTRWLDEHKELVRIVEESE